jgi:isoleucyl-tRNA synthetase
LRYLLGNLFDFDHEKDAVPFARLDEIDQWAVGKCVILVSEVEEDYNSFRFHHIYRMIYNFCVIEMSSFYLDVLKDRMYTAGKKSAERLSSQTAMFFILHNLVKILAPILSFTTDELWKSFTMEKGCSSVHLADWPKLGSMSIPSELIARWEKLRELRELVNPLIENKRTADIIGSSLEAKVDLYIEQNEAVDFLKEYEHQLALVFIVSQVYIHTDADIDTAAESIIDFDSARIGVTVTTADGEKCVRCWNFSTQLGSDSDHPELCPKCTQAII